MRFASRIKDMIARWLLKLLGTSPEQDFVEKTLAQVQMELMINGNLSVIDANGKLK